MTETFALTRPQARWALRLVPPFPAVAQRLMDLAGREDVSLQEVGAVVKMDPSFFRRTAAIRQLRPLRFPPRNQKPHPRHRHGGMERVKTMATLVALNRMVRHSVQVQALRKVWIHSLVTATLMEEAARSAHLSAETAYTVGLLHNLGTLGLMSAYPDEYSRMLEISNDFGFNLLETERDLFDIDHCLAGSYLAQDWDCPDELAAAIAIHHDDPVPEDPGLDNLIRVCWRLSDALGYAAFSPDREWLYDELLNFLPDPRACWFGESAEAARGELARRLRDVPL